MPQTPEYRDPPPRGNTLLREREYRPVPPAHRPVGVLAAFVQRYGWRAYALPILTVITVVALMTSGQTPTARPPAASHAAHPASSAAPKIAAARPSAPPTASGDQPLTTDTPSAGSNNEALVSDQLPDGAPYTTTGTGKFQTLPGTTAVVGAGPLKKYTIDVEGGITGVDLTAFAAKVDAVLDDPRSWAGAGHGVSLQRVSSGSADFHVSLTSSMTVRSLCGYELPIETSCWAPTKGNRVVLNVARWIRGDAAYLNNVDLYRTYMVNHEDGHALGHLHSHVCLTGGLAPVMMQQTIGLKAVGGAMCQANAWPYPPGATDAPGIEAPDDSSNDESVLITQTPAPAAS